MKTNIEDITNKVSYTKIYDVLTNSNNLNFSFDDLASMSNVFNIINDDFYSSIANQFKQQLLIFACMLSDTKGYMSLYLFSFIISSLDECINLSTHFKTCIRSFNSNNKDQNVIMLKSFNKILTFYYNNMSNSPPLHFYTENGFLYRFCDLDINLIKDILSFNKSYNFKYINLFMQSLLNIVCLLKKVY